MYRTMTNDTKDAICAAIRGFFASKKITMTEAAQRLGLSKAAVSNQLDGRPFGQRTAAKWADTFGFSASYLLTGEGSLVPGEPAKAAPAAVTLPGELVGMFTDMAATIRSQQDTVAQLSDLVGRLAGQPAAGVWAKKEPASSTEEAGRK